MQTSEIQGNSVIESDSGLHVSLVALESFRSLSRESSGEAEPSANVSRRLREMIIAERGGEEERIACNGNLAVFQAAARRNEL